MNDLGLSVGMYLIAWPDQTRWTTEGNRRSKVPIDREDIESRLEDQAHAYSASGRTINVVHIDIPYGRIDGYDDRLGTPSVSTPRAKKWRRSCSRRCARPASRRLR